MTTGEERPILAARLERRFSYFARVDRYSSTKGGRITILLVDVLDTERRYVADHVWVVATKSLLEAKVQRDDVLAFSAVASEYTDAGVKRYGMAQVLNARKLATADEYQAAVRAHYAGTPSDT